MVNKPKHISGSWIDVYIKKILMTEFPINASVKNIYFSDQDDIGIVIEQTNVVFHTVL